MNITSPILTGAFRAAELPGDSVTALLKMVGAGTGLFDDNVGWRPRHGDVRARRRRRSTGGSDPAVDLFPAAATAARATSSSMVLPPRSSLALLAFVAYDMRHAALAYLGINPAKPAIEFEIRLPRSALMTVAYTEVVDARRSLSRCHNPNFMISTSGPYRIGPEGSWHARISPDPDFRYPPRPPLTKLTDNFHRVSEHIDATRPDLVVNSGDLAFDGADQPRRSRIRQDAA